MITLKNINKSYGNKVIFKDMNVEFNEKGTITAVLGESGSGKTTLLNLLFGIDQDFSGDFLLDNKDVKDFSSGKWDKARNNTMQIVYQDYKLIEEFTVYDNLLSAINKNDESDDIRIKESLTQMDLLETINLPVKNISGGQKQRLALCRAVINSPQILLLDESTGNLDDKNTENILNYVEKFKEKGIIVIIITHDSRILNRVDFIYNLENHTLLLKENDNKKANDKEIKKENTINATDIMVKKQPILKFMSSNIKASKKDIFYTYVPMFFIFCIFVLLINVFKGVTTSSLDELFGGIDDKTIFIDINQVKQEFKDELSEKNIQLLSDGKRIGFSDEDLQNVRNIEGVKRAAFVNRDVTSTTDIDEYSLKEELQKEEFSGSVKNSISFSKFKGSTLYKFGSLNLPYEYIRNYDINNIEIIAGDFPKNDYAILIPDMYAFYLEEEFGVTLEELINKKVELDVIDNKIINPTMEDLEPVKKEYTICGIYNSGYRNVIPAIQTIYLKNSNRNVKMTEALYNDGYRFDIDVILSTKNKETKDYMSGIYGNIESYKKAYGRGSSQMMVEVDNTKDLESVTKKIDEFLPVYAKLSQYDIKTGEVSNIYKILNFTFLAVMLVVSLVFGIIIAFMNKSVMVKRNKRMSILYSLGYSRKKVMGIILSEIFIFSFVTVTMAIALVVALNHFILQYTVQYKLFNDILGSGNYCTFTVSYL